MFSSPNAIPALEVTPELLLGKQGQQNKNQQQDAVPTTHDIAGPAGARACSSVKTTVLPCSLFGLKRADLPTLLQKNPLFDTKSAAVFLCVSEEVLKKWRQRGYGPEYIQYEQCGLVRYALNSLLKFRAEHTVIPGKNRSSK